MGTVPYINDIYFCRQSSGRVASGVARSPSAEGDAALESEAAYSHQGRPYLWCGTAERVELLVLHSGSRDGVSQSA